jgi:hypothetical protein
LGFNTGTRTACFAASIALPNAEQVNRIASAPQPSQYRASATKRSMIVAVMPPAAVRS